MFLRRTLPFLIVASLCSFFLFAVLSNGGLSWSTLPQAIGFGEKYGPTEEQIASGENILPDLRVSSPRPNFSGFHEPKIENQSPYGVGETKPPGSNYTKCLVIPRTKTEDTSWIEKELGDMMESGLLQTAVYTVNDKTAKLHPPKNKGHEVMVYLSYIIDNYEDLADVSLFMHAHQFTWHNNELLERDAAQMVRHLSPERVTREGYMNLRCHWDPGCPEWLHPGATVRNVDKQEEVLLAESWSQLFPLDAIPTVLAQPCCAQFAVSRDRILKTNKMRYIYMRDWLIKTELSDYLSGRIFEYIWQFIFNKAPIHCPSMSACYCDGYGLCFGTQEKFERWFELRFQQDEFKEKLRVWQEKADLIDEWRKDAKEGKMVEEAMLEVPEVGRDKEYRQNIKELQEELDKSKQDALELGKDPKQRARESDRQWKAGDGF
ncbi:Hypothetical predicted protein [Lecanosticta acicola]|uniref:Uncharacterized protein n=1 Tax=Lecanosticta acicola TaxID=111012 RepID=A0AAI9ECR8_9PEZI|nr:Hypothetical predicted protein [Lecanosticta acicola]